MYTVRINEKPFFVWDSALFAGGSEYGCSADEQEAQELRTLIKADEEPNEEDVEETARTQNGETRFCYMLRFPRALTSVATRLILSSVDEFARHMHEEPDVQVTFGSLSSPNYLRMLGKLSMQRRVPKGQSCLVLNAQANRIILAMNKPPVLIRISSLPYEHTPLPAA